MGKWTRQELQEAHDQYLAAAQEAGRSHDWSVWADRFTEDATYIEHHYGTFEGRAAILDWISKTMGEWPNSEMTIFPHNWCVCDEETGRWICEIENRFEDPGDGQIYEASNITILTYAGRGAVLVRGGRLQPGHLRAGGQGLGEGQARPLLKVAHTPNPDASTRSARSNEGSGPEPARVASRWSRVRLWRVGDDAEAESPEAAHDGVGRIVERDDEVFVGAR